MTPDQLEVARALDWTVGGKVRDDGVGMLAWVDGRANLLSYLIFCS